MSQQQRIVQKYGGTSLADVERLRNVAARIKRARDGGCQLIAVVSAMAGETDRLLALAHAVSPRPAERELDVLLSTGEQASTALFSMALAEAGVPAVSLQGHQVRIATDSSFGRARIRSIDVSRIEEALENRQVAVVAGFQGIDDRQNITTLGRGGSDTTAVALAAALEADACEIYTDVAGVFTADPRVCPDAVKLDRISYDEMIELAGKGTKVLQIRSVEAAKRYGVRVCVRSSFDEQEGTWIVPEESTMEEVLVSGVAFDRDQAKITLQGVPDRPGLAAAIFGPLAEAGVVIDMIVQNVAEDGRTDLTFTVASSDLERTDELVRGMAAEVGARGVLAHDGMAKVSVVGLGMRNHAGVAARAFELLADEGINIQMISTSEIKISVVVDRENAERAVRVLHSGFVGREAEAVGGSSRA